MNDDVLKVLFCEITYIWVFHGINSIKLGLHRVISTLCIVDRVFGEVFQGIYAFNKNIK